MNKFLSSFFLVAFTTALYAQSIIPRIGMTVSRTNAEDEQFIEQKSVTGFVLGVAAEWPLNASLSVQPEFNFVQKGFGVKADISDQGLTVQVDNRTTINYLELPVLLKYYVNDADTRVYLIAGPSIGYGLGGKAKSKVDTDFFGTNLSVTVNGKVKFGDPPPGYNPLEDTEIYFDNRIDFGLQGGLGVLIKNAVV
nr:PorT family protein [Cyclobacteriaceae bacterium]